MTLFFPAAAVEVFLLPRSVYPFLRGEGIEIRKSAIKKVLPRKIYKIKYMRTAASGYSVRSQ